MGANRIDHLLPVVQRHAIEAQQAIAGLEPGRDRRPFRIQFGQHRWQSRAPRANTQRADRVRLVGALEPVVEGQYTRYIGARTFVTHGNFKRAALAQATYQLQIDLRPAAGCLAIY
ncbi:hypothetical protein D9M73_183500 [compost metagenome]